MAQFGAARGTALRLRDICSLVPHGANQTRDTLAPPVAATASARTSPGDVLNPVFPAAGGNEKAAEAGVILIAK